jgi:2-polyprenyl-3-methyl-5-hydroxy-6-metoxy-1,4-benzoquinol methylase
VAVSLKLDQIGMDATPRCIAMGSLALAHLVHRRRRPELMDQPGVDPAEHALALNGLGRINRVSRSAAILWPPIARLAQAAGSAPVRVLDLASGGGDIPLALAFRAARARLDVRIDGCDINDGAVRFARQKAANCSVPVQFFTLDALTSSIPEGYDVLTCSLFLHHLDEPDAVRLLRRMASAARRLVLLDDLVRSRVGYALAWGGCRLLSRSPIVRHDGPASVAAAFTPEEVQMLALRAGLESVSLTRHWPHRFLLSWSR